MSLAGEEKGNVFLAFIIDGHTQPDKEQFENVTDLANFTVNVLALPLHFLQP